MITKRDYLRMNKQDINEYKSHLVADTIVSLIIILACIVIIGVLFLLKGCCNG